jgi:hypothetical protein
MFPGKVQPTLVSGSDECPFLGGELATGFLMTRILPKITTEYHQRSAIKAPDCQGPWACNGCHSAQRWSERKP